MLAFVQPLPSHIARFKSDKAQRWGLRFAMFACHYDVTALAHQEPSSVHSSRRNVPANPPTDHWRDMFTINDTTTAAINILGAIDALESALDRRNVASDSIMTTDQERELLTLGIRDTLFILGMHRMPLPKVLSLLSLQMANSLGFSGARASAALREFRLVEELAEGSAAPDARAA
jgi:hypothetical protein